MLHIKTKLSVLLALTFTAAAGHAVAGDRCELSDGYALSPVAFATEAEACLEGVDGIDIETWMESEIRRQTHDVRRAESLETIDNLASLNEAARLHAMDMAARSYAAHQDLEGRDHLDRVRILDRKRLIGASGANLTILPATASPEAAFKALISDSANAANLTRDAFTHMGVGAASDGKNVYIVQLFARVDGSLNKPLPMVLASKADLTATYADASFSSVGWSLENANGKMVASGLNDRLYGTANGDQYSKLNIDVAYGSDVYTLKGPIVTMQ